MGSFEMSSSGKKVTIKIHILFYNTVMFRNTEVIRVAIVEFVLTLL